MAVEVVGRTTRLRRAKLRGERGEPARHGRVLKVSSFTSPHSYPAYPMWTIRRATIADIDTLVDLRTRFLGEIGYAGNSVVDAVRDYFHVALPQDEFVAWVAEAGSSIIAMGGLVYCQKVPHGRNVSGREGFILNIYTLPEWRGRGIATALMNAIVEHVRGQQITCIRLHATEDGVGIYSKLGFGSENTEMILDLTNTKFDGLKPGEHAEVESEQTNHHALHKFRDVPPADE